MNMSAMILAMIGAGARSATRFAALLCLATGTAQAQSAAIGKDGYELFIQCSARHSAFNEGVCLGYLGGAIDALVSAAEAPGFCLPEGAPLAAVQEAYVAAFANRTVPRGTDASAAVLTVLTAAYPCPPPDPE